MTKKIAISLPDVTLGKARAAVKGCGAASISRYIVRLIEDASARETFEQMLAEWVRERGATAAEIRAAEKESHAAFARAGLTRRTRPMKKSAFAAARTRRLPDDGTGCAKRGPNCRSCAC